MKKQFVSFAENRGYDDELRGISVTKKQIEQLSAAEQKAFYAQLRVCDKLLRLLHFLLAAPST